MNKGEGCVITRHMRDLLIAHMDGPVALVAGDLHQKRPRAAALCRGLIKTDGCKFPKKTYITAAGRAVLAKALADWADAIVRVRSQAESRPEPARARRRVLQDAE